MKPTRKLAIGVAVFVCLLYLSKAYSVGPQLCYDPINLPPLKTASAAWHIVNGTTIVGQALKDPNFNLSVGFNHFYETQHCYGATDTPYPLPARTWLSLATILGNYDINNSSICIYNLDDVVSGDGVINYLNISVVFPDSSFAFNYSFAVYNGTTPHPVRQYPASNTTGNMPMVYEIVPGELKLTVEIFNYPWVSNSSSLAVVADVNTASDRSQHGQLDWFEVIFDVEFLRFSAGFHNALTIMGFNITLDGSVVAVIDDIDTPYLWNATADNTNPGGADRPYFYSPSPTSTYTPPSDLAVQLIVPFCKEGVFGSRPYTSFWYDPTIALLFDPIPQSGTKSIIPPIVGSIGAVAAVAIIIIVAFKVPAVSQFIRPFVFRADKKQAAAKVAPEAISPEENARDRGWSKAATPASSWVKPSKPNNV